MSTPPSIGDVLNNILSAINSVIGAIATAIADNAEVIGTVVIVGALAVSVMSIGKKVFSGLSGWFRGLTF
jgi:hypothetical protein